MSSPENRGPAVIAMTKLIISVPTIVRARAIKEAFWVGNDVLHRRLSASSGLDFGILSLCSRSCVSLPTPVELVSYDHRLA